MTVAQWANTVVSGFVVVCDAVFIGMYHRQAPWWSSGMGRYLMVFAATIGLLASYTVVMTVVGLDGVTATVLRIVRSCLLLTVAGLLLQGARAIRQEQQRQK
ncbi:hypothetical protein ABTY96_46400 [Streptomyces sp. NPDC096057]|uniref:putative phage holin n=1 Tax=Streptomyces sp. NPDC096057 TaxID=3155543 RepID=UPI00331A3C9B